MVQSGKNFMINKMVHMGKSEIDNFYAKKSATDWPPERHFWQIIRSMEVNSILDIGTGMSGVVGLYFWDKLNIPRKVALDIYKIRDMPPSWETKIMNALDIPTVFGSQSFDVVQACEVIEHLDKADGWKLLHIMEETARKAILLTTPLGFQPRPASESLNPENPHQTHLSGWTYTELEQLGYSFPIPERESESRIIAWKVREHY